MNNIKPGSFKYRQIMDRKLKRASKPSAVRKNPCLKSVMEKLYEKRGTTGDIKFMVDGEEIHAHRCVLAALSPRYEAQFYGAMAESNTINVEDVSPAAFKEFVQFFYLDEVTLTLDNIEDVLNLAKQWLVDELIVECTNFILNVVGMDKLFWSYRLAVGYGIKLLEDFCVKQIKMNIKTVFQMTGFLSCDSDLLCRILSIDSLNCQEVEVFDACILWAQAKCKRDGLDATDTANLRAALGEALPKIQSRSKKIKERLVPLINGMLEYYRPKNRMTVYRMLLWITTNNRVWNVRSAEDNVFAVNHQMHRSAKLSSLAVRKRLN